MIRTGPERLTLRGIEIFVATLEEGSVVAAAERLGASASAVSQQLSNLETALGTRLMVRTTRPVALTPAGHMFHRRALRILQEATQARAELAAMDFSRLTRLRMAMIEDFDADVTPQLLSQLAQSMPGCQISLGTGPSHRNLSLLESRETDVAVAAAPDALPDWIEGWPLLREPMVVLVARGVISPNQPALPQLMALPFIRYSPKLMVGQMIEAHLARHGIDIPVRFELDSYHAIMSMASAGTGWSIAPVMTWLNAQRFQDRVEILPLPLAGLARRIMLFARRDYLDTMPRDMAARMVPLLQELVVDRVTGRYPWLAGELRVMAE